jgi:hypothetical protein
MRLRLNVTVRPGSREEPTRRGADGAWRARGLLSLGASFADRTSEVFEWANRSTENANLLLADPAAAVRRSGVKLSASDQRALMRHVEALSTREALPAGVELVGVDVTVAAAPYARRKRSSARGNRTDEERRRRRGGEEGTTRGAGGG